MDPLEAWIAVIVTPWVIGPTMAMHFFIGAMAITAVRDPEGRVLTLAV